MMLIHPIERVHRRIRAVRVIRRDPVMRARVTLKRLNAFLGRYHTLSADNPLITSRDNLAYAIETGGGLDTAAEHARRALRDAAFRAVKAGAT